MKKFRAHIKKSIYFLQGTLSPVLDTFAFVIVKQLDVQSTAHQTIHFELCTILISRELALIPNTSV
jgi:hypothetical protein